jgi:TRAP-type transport system small permease protein
MKVISFLSRVASYIAMVTVMAMMLMTVTDVVMRYVFTRPLSGIPELTEYMLAVCLLGIVPCAMAKRHIKVDIILEHLPPKAASILDAITLAISMVLAAIMAWQSFMGGLFAIKNDVYSAMLEIPAVPFFMVVALSFGLLVLVMIVLLIERIMEAMSQ